MKYIKSRTERESDTRERLNTSVDKGNVIKRALVLFVMTICLVLAGAHSVPATRANAPGCELVCNDTYTDPKTGQCFFVCCPQDKECMNRCELIPCDGQKTAK